MGRLVICAAALLSVSFGATAHEWYSGLKMPGTRMSCCNDRDCEPVEHRYGVGGRDELLIDGKWLAVPQSRVLGAKSPDGRWHACSPDGKLIRCVIEPGGAV